MVHERFTIASAHAACRAGRLEAWVHGFLEGAGGNAALSAGLRREPRRFHGPLAIPLRLLERCAGPEPGLAFRVSRASFEARVGRIAAALAGGEELPPLIVSFSAGPQLVVSDGNHRLEALRRLGREACAAVLWTTGAADAEACEAWRRGAVAS